MILLNNPRFTSIYIVTRQSAGGSFVQGRWVDAATPTAIPIRASVQRLSSRDTLILPEAYRTSASYRVYSKTELLSVDNVGAKNCDSITIEGKIYDILSIDKWTQLVPHYKSIAVRREEVSI